MAEINILTKSNVTHTYTGTANGAGANSIDGDFGTYQGVYLTSDGTATAISQHEWSTPITVDKVSFKVHVQAIAHSEYECSECSAAYYVEYKNSGGSWVLFAPAAATYYQNQTSSQHGGSFYTFTSESNAGQQTMTGLGVTGVYGVRVRCIATSGVSGGGSYESELAYIYEIQVLREKYEAVLRYSDNGTIYSIGSIALGTNKLRIRKNGTTYAIPLLATTDVMASPIRIYDGSSVKSLALAD